MTSSSSLKMESMNPCCVLWRTRYSKMEEKRNALRQGVEILKAQIDRQQLENAALQRAVDEKQAQLNNVKEEKGKETSLGISVKNENAGFNSEISPTKPEVIVDNVVLEKEVTQLRTCVSEKDVEINRLRQLLTEETMKCDVEKKTAESERKKASELQKSLDYEKNKAGEACKIADATARKAEDYKLQFETLNNKLEKTKLKLEEVNRIHEVEKRTLIKEKVNSVEMRVKEEQCRANTLLMQLEEEKQKVERLQKEMQELMVSNRSIDSSESDEVKREFETEKQKVAQEKRLVENEKEKVIEQRRILENEKMISEERCRMVTLAKQLEDEKQKNERLQKKIQEMMLTKRSVDSSELDEVKKMFEAEKKKVSQERKLVEEEKERVLEQKRIAEENGKMISEERCRADTLVKQLEDEKQKVEILQKQMQEIMMSNRSVDSSELDEVKKKFEAEKKKVARERRLVEEEKERVIEQRRIAEENGKMFSEERCRADALVKQLEDEKQKVERLQKEMQEIMLSKKSIVSSELDEVKRLFEAEKKKVAHEKRLVEEEKERELEQRRIAEMNEKMFSEERCRADKLLMQLEEEKLKVENLQKKMRDVASQKPADFLELNGLKRTLEIEKEKAAMENKSVEEYKARAMEQRSIAETNEKRFLEEKCRADNLLMQLEEEKRKVGKLQREMQEVISSQKIVSSSMLNEVYSNLEADAVKERNHVDMEKSESDEQGKIAKANEMKVREEKQRCENSLHELELARQKLQNMEKELHEVKLCMGLVGTSAMSSPFVMNEQAARVNTLQEQLKFEKKRVKHVKEVAKLEKGRNTFLQQELRKVKNDFQCLVDHLSMLSDIFGARNGPIYLPQKSQMHFRGDEEVRMSGLTSRNACLQMPSMKPLQAGHFWESTSGMENELDNLREGSRGDTLPSSALNSNTASFSDEQLVGSQERLGDCYQRATVLRDCSEFLKHKNGKNTGSVGEHNPRSTVEASTDHAKKRRKMLDEFESIKCMELEGKKIFQEAEENENLPFSITKSNLCGNFDCSSKKMMPLHEPEVGHQQAAECVIQMDVSPSVMETRESSQPLQIIMRDEIKQNQDALAAFEQIVNDDYMKLLDLDDADAEKCFRMMMEKPLSPLRSELDLLEFGQEVGAHTPDLFIPEKIVSAHNNVSTQIENQLQFVMFSDMEDIGSKARIFGATRICVAQFLSSLQTLWSGQHILEALLLEKNLRPREKACVFFTFMLLNFSFVSSCKSESLHFQEQMNSFSAHIRSVLFNFQTRESWAKICDISDILSLGEDFILNKKIFSNNVPSELLDDSGAVIEIMHEGDKILLCSKLASPDLVLAGSILLASISKAVGLAGSVCEASPKVLQVGRADYSLTLSILHIFAYICGEDYFTISKYSSIMKVVKSVVVFIEVSLAKNASKDQPGKTKHPFTPCVSCPFLEGSVSLNDVSLELLADLQQYTVPQNPAVHSSNSEGLPLFLCDVISSLDIIRDIKGWDWVCDIIMPKLFEMLESNLQDSIFSTALVVLLASLGRLGVEERGYNDTGVECIKRHILSLLSQIAASKCNANVPMTLVYGLIDLYPKGREMFQKCFNVKLPSKEGISASPSEIVSKFLSYVGNEQLSSGLVNSNVAIPP